MVNCIVTYFLIADVLRSVRGPFGRVLQTTLILLSKAWKSVIHLWKIRHLYGLTRICFLVALPARLLVIGFGDLEHNIIHQVSSDTVVVMVHGSAILKIR